MVEVAQAASKTNSSLRAFFLRIVARKGKNVATVALARKILCIVHHLLKNNEEYQEEGFEKEVRLSFPKFNFPPLQKMAEILRNAGYLIQPPPTSSKIFFIPTTLQAVQSSLQFPEGVLLSTYFSSSFRSFA